MWYKNSHVAIDCSTLLAVTGLVFYFILAIGSIFALAVSTRIFHRKVAMTSLTYNLPGVSIIKPLMGIDPLLEINLESHFRISYPKFELLFCVQNKGDPAIELVRQLCQKYPKVDSRILIGGKDGIINPMVHNMVPGYGNAKYDFIWICSSRVKVSSDVILDLAVKLLPPDVAMVHQMPFTSDYNTTFGGALEKVYFGCRVAQTYMFLYIFNITCVVGMSYMVKKSVLDKVGGLEFYGKYLSEDYYLSNALRDSGHRLVISSYPAQQNVADVTVRAYKDRMVRWMRLRMNMLPKKDFLIELLSACIPLGIIVTWSLCQLTCVNPFYVLCGHITMWSTRDYLHLRVIQNGSLPFGIHTFICVWLFREIMAIGIFVEAFLNRHMVPWGDFTYKLKPGGRTERVATKAVRH